MHIRLRPLAYLPQADEQVENVRIVVEHGAVLHIRVKLRLALGVERLVKVLLAHVEEILAHDDRPGGQG